MSTEIKDREMERGVVLAAQNWNLRVVDIAVRTADGCHTWVSTRRADFLAGVEAECDGIFIRRADLPGIDLTSDGKPYAGGQTSQSAEQSRDVARAHLALAEYLDAHPPIDEAQVNALKSILWGQPISMDAAELARTLIATGKVTVTR